MALPVTFPRPVGIRDMMTALPGSPRAVPPTDGQISSPHLLHGARATCLQPVWWQCPAWKHINPKPDEACRSEGLLGSDVADSDRRVMGRVIALEFY